MGHKALLHGCSIEDDVLIGMGAIVMNGARIGQGSIVGAGAVVLEGFECPAYSLVVGNPAYIKKTYPPTICEKTRKTAASYVERAKYYKGGLRVKTIKSHSSDISASIVSTAHWSLSLVALTTVISIGLSVLNKLRSRM